MSCSSIDIHQGVQKKKPVEGLHVEMNRVAKPPPSKKTTSAAAGGAEKPTTSNTVTPADPIAEAQGSSSEKDEVRQTCDSSTNRAQLYVMVVDGTCSQGFFFWHLDQNSFYFFDFF